jgi:hypothetical protein
MCLDIFGVGELAAKTLQTDARTNPIICACVGYERIMARLIDPCEPGRGLRIPESANMHGRVPLLLTVNSARRFPFLIGKSIQLPRSAAPTPNYMGVRLVGGATPKQAV